MMASRNITLSLPEEDVRRARILAAHRGISVSRLLAEVLGELVDRDAGYTQAKARNLRAMASAADLGTQGQATWTRDELHDR